MLDKYFFLRSIVDHRHNLQIWLNHSQKNSHTHMQMHETCCEIHWQRWQGNLYDKTLKSVFIVNEKSWKSIDLCSLWIQSIAIIRCMFFYYFFLFHFLTISFVPMFVSIFGHDTRNVFIIERTYRVLLCRHKAAKLHLKFMYVLYSIRFV
jgi:hypothetical protein